MRGLLSGGDIIFFYCINNNQHVIEEVGGQSPPSDFASFRRKKCTKSQKHEKKAGITSFSRYAAEEGELGIVRPSWSGGFSPRNFFLNSCPFSAKFFNEKSLRGEGGNCPYCLPPLDPPL